MFNSSGTGQSDQDGPSAFNLFIMFSIGLVALTLIGFALLIVVGVAGIGSNTQGRTQGPYNLVARPIPTVQTAREVLPQKLGEFTRGQVFGTVQQFNAVYTSTDGSKIEIRGSQSVNIRAAQASVSDVAHSGGIGGASQRQLDSDPSYILSSGSGPIRYAWSHERWFFDIKASSQAALDAFMKSFNY